MILKNTTLTNSEIIALTSFLKQVLKNNNNSIYLKKESSLYDDDIRPYNFKEPDKFSRAQLQTLNIIFESFAREATAYLTNITNSACEVEVVNVVQKSYSEIVKNMPDLTILNIFTFKGLEGQGVLEMSPETLFCIVEKAFGGVGGSVPKARELTTIERRLQSTLVNSFLNIMNTSFEDLTVLEPKLEQIETNPQFIQQLLPPMEICVSIMLKVRVSGYRTSGLINISLSFSMLEPLCPRLNSHLWFVESKTSNSSNTLFKEKMVNNLNNAPVELKAEIGTVNLKLSEVNSLKKDSIIVLNKKISEPIDIYLENCKKFLGTPHLLDDRKVLKIEEIINSDK